MSIDSQSFSLKGSDGRWKGLGEQSTMLPAPAMFSELSGCYVSDDGTELKPVPGNYYAGRMFFGQEWAISSVADAGGGLATITIFTTNPHDLADYDDDALPSQTGDACYLPGSGTFKVYISDVTGDEITPGYYDATRTGGDTFTIAHAVSTPRTDGKCLIQRGAATHALTHVGDRVVGVCRTEAWQDSGSNKVDNVSSVVSTAALPTSPSGARGPQYQRTWSEETANHPGWVFWPSPTLTGMNLGDGADYVAASGYRYICAANSLRIGRRIQADALDNKVVIAVPDCGMLHQVDISSGPPWITMRPPDTTRLTDTGVGPGGLPGIPSDDLPNHRWTKALGIPRGAIISTTPGTSGTDWYVGCAVAYMDVITGEVGLPSPIWVQSGMDASTLTIRAYMPRGMCYEATGLAVITFMTEAMATPEEARYGVLQSVNIYGPWSTGKDYPLYSENEGAAPTNAYSQFTSVSNVTLGSSAHLTYTSQPRRTPAIELMPPGGMVLRVARGRVFSGGNVTRLWEFCAWTDSQALSGTDNKLRVFMGLPSERYSAGSAFGNPVMPMTHGIIPDAWGGYRVQRSEWTGSGYGRGRILSRVDVESLSTIGSIGPRIYEVDFDGGDTSPFPGSTPILYKLLGEALRIGFTEEGFPYVSPATNRLELDSLNGTTVMGIARLGDTLLAMTERETLLFQWNAMPRQSSQAVVSNRYGCAGPSSVVEYPGGVAWLSLHGPVNFSGSGVQWIGRSLKTLWSTVKKDSSGEVHYSTATVDQDRGIVIWPLRTTAWGNEDDEEKAESKSDLLLMWSYVTGEFSTYVPSTESRPAAMNALPYDDGTLRPTLSVDNAYFDLYGWDDDVLDRESSTNLSTPLDITASRSGSSTNVTVSSGASNHSTGDYGFIYSSDGKTIRWFGQVTVTNDTTVVALSSDGAVWHSGDKMQLGVLPMRMTTQRFRVGADPFDNIITGFSIRADLSSATVAFARVNITGVDYNGDSSTASFTGRWGKPLVDGITRFESGLMRAVESEIDIQIWANGGVSVKDIILDLQGADRGT